MHIVRRGGINDLRRPPSFWRSFLEWKVQWPPPLQANTPIGKSLYPVLETLLVPLGSMVPSRQIRWPICRLSLPVLGVHLLLKQASKTNASTKKALDIGRDRSGVGRLISLLGEITTNSSLLARKGFVLARKGFG
jgi:hypothetical protein